jgi:hypothetical protein
MCDLGTQSGILRLMTAANIKLNPREDTIVDYFEMCFIPPSVDRPIHVSFPKGLLPFKPLTSSKYLKG